MYKRQTLRTYDNKTITIPNGIINTSILVNHSKEGIRRVDCQFRIGYDSDVSLAKELMHGICAVSYTHLDVYKRQQ